MEAPQQPLPSPSPLQQEQQNVPTMHSTATHTLQMIVARGIDHVLDCFVCVGNAKPLLFKMQNGKASACQPIHVEGGDTVTVTLCKPSGKRVTSGCAVLPPTIPTDDHRMWVPLCCDTQNTTSSSLFLQLDPIIMHHTMQSPRTSVVEASSSPTPSPAELHAAIQLQQWRITQEKQFMTQLNNKAKECMAQLDREWEERVAGLEAAWAQRQQQADARTEEARSRYVGYPQ